MPHSGLVIAWLISFLVGGLRGEDYPVDDPLYWKQKPYLKAINLPAAWKRLWGTKKRRERVTVALVDTGVYKHPDIAGNLVTGYNVTGKNTDTDDKQGHGTQVAGILGATLNNNLLIAGVADLVDIMPIAIRYPFTQDQMTDAVDYVISNRQKHNIKILLMAASSNTIQKALALKVQEAVNAGLLLVVTVGNHGQNVTANKRWPCALTIKLDGMLCVGGMAQTEMRISRQSNYANYLDIAAPGDKITTLTKDFKFTDISGSSAASAIVAGVAALVYSISPHLTSREVKGILKDTATKGVEDPSYKEILPFGRVDANKAIEKAEALKL
ncbi:hypothetical protein FOL47_008671 [Perkinsus chesapeaki]|uniref:subtilisin n=1 Tax=Perkinsus chesapeaki TaxID=330153 RepID=A0A7J6LCF0_PERCH|nr:hypothetical protein FOL47_008671 [Perkinsus chesapeaki]